MKLFAQCAVLAASLFTLTAFAECETPSMVDVPDGASASLDQMLAAQSAVRDFLAKMEEYLSCVNDEIDAQPEDTPEEIRALMVERYNNGVTEMETVAARFNEQRIAYQNANPSK